MNICGIYAIINWVNGKMYIGKTTNMQKRWREHKSSLNRENYKHENKQLIRAWQKYGENNFTCELLEECSMELLNEREKYWIKELKTYGHKGKYGYNSYPGGQGFGYGEDNPNFGKHISDEKKKKLSMLFSGRPGTKHTEETKKIMSIKVKERYKDKSKTPLYGKINADSPIYGIKRSNSSSQYIGVFWEKRRKRWVSRITFNGKMKWLGYFTSEEDAARAYDKKATELFGDKAKLNFPNEVPLMIEFV